MVVKVENLVKRYTNHTALDHLNLEVGEGEVFGILGPAGAGKTTALNCMLSLLEYEKGTITVFDRPMVPEAYEIKRRIGAVFQNAAVFNELTVYENVWYFCSLYKKNREEVVRLTEEALRFVGMEDYGRFYPKKLSSGLLMRLNLACGIAHKPELIFLDEPAGEADPQSRSRILEGIEKLNQNGATIIFTSHNMDEVEQLCHRIAIMDRGRIVAQGTREELKGMISLGEKINIRVYELEPEQEKELRAIQNVYFVEYDQGMLTVKSKKGRNNLAAVLEYLTREKIPFGQVATQLPTLNDVFLEITGKELRG